MSPRAMVRPGIAGLLLLVGGGAAAQRTEPVTALRSVERGLWQLKSASGGERKFCLTSVPALLQIQHGGAQCQHFVLENMPRTATIRYTCAGHGHGRTVLTVETGKLISLDTQGVADGSPFSEQYEGRLIGGC